jgi:sugar phosphate isomerase/epimerase
MDRLGIEFLSVFGLPPVEFVNLAADLGCHYISTGLGPGPAPFEPPPYRAFSLADDAALRSDMISAMADRDVSISLGEGMIVHPGTDVQDHAATLDVMAELGVRRINTLSLDPDRQRAVDQFGALVEMAAAREMETTLETSPGFTPEDLPMALEIIGEVGRPDFRLLVDTMHIVRGGSSAADLAAVDPSLIGYVQLSDVPLVSTGAQSYYEEALFDRRVPGTGELPLLDILAAVPADVVIGLEVPNRADAKAGLSPHERLGRCVDAARDLLAQLDQRKTPTTP